MKILIVDDNKEEVDLIIEYLKCKYDEKRCTIFKAYDGKEALGIVLKEFPDLIITDIDMPVLDGASFIQEIRKRYIEIPILAISSFKIFSVDFKNYKANEFLEKPFSSEQLYEKINNIIRIGG